MVRRVRKRQIQRCRRRKQRGGFLNGYDFAYAGTDTANTAMKNVERIPPELMKQLSDQVNQVAQQRIQLIIDQGGQKVEKLAPKIIRGTIENVYQTPFRLLGTFGKKKPKSTQTKSKLRNKIHQTFCPIKFIMAAGQISTTGEKDALYQQTNHFGKGLKMLKTKSKQ